MKIKNRVRVLDTGSLSASENMALDETILEAREEGSIPDTIRFLSFNPHCALVGYFQTIENELRTSFCRQNGIDINRRITGGGALYWGTQDIGWEFFFSKDSFKSKISNMEGYYKLFCTAASAGINSFGINSSFRPRNDIEINGKKISGSGGTSIANAYLFQGTLLVDINLNLMIRALKIPIEKLKYDEIDSLKERVTWLSRELGYLPSRAEIINKLLGGFTETLEISWYFDELSRKEKEILKQKIVYFKSKKHINRVKERKSGYFLKSIEKTEKGIIKCTANMDFKRNVLKKLVFTGDFFIYPRRAIFDLESILKNIQIRKDNIREIVNNFYNNYQQSIEGVTSQNLISVINKCLNKLEFKKYKIPLKYFNDIFIVEVNGNHFEKFKIEHKIEILLLPYCVKMIECSFRYRDGCNFCEMCSFGEVVKLAYQKGIRDITIISYECLEENLKSLKADGIKFFAGCCCEAFYIKHKEDFEKIGLPGVLINIDNKTCYDLGREKEAHNGRFEGFTELKIPLIKKILEIFNKDD